MYDKETQTDQSAGADRCDYARSDVENKEADDSS